MAEQPFGRVRLIEMVVESVRVHMLSSQHVVILKESERDRYLPIWIGPAEANAIAMRLQGLTAERPLTHDLLKNVIEDLGHTIDRVRITSLQDGVFHAVLDIDGGAEGAGQSIDSRSSDAIALALRAGVDIVTTEDLLEEAGVAMAGEQEDDEVEKFKEFLDHVSADDFDTGDQPSS